MSRGSSDNFLSVINNEYPNDIFIHLVTVFWPDGSTSYYAKNYEPVTSRGQSFQEAGFKINLPEEPTDSVPTLRMNFNIGERTLPNKLLDSVEPPLVRFEIVLASDPDIVELGPFDFDVREFEAQGTSVSVEVGFEPILDLSIPQIAYTPTLMPGLFKSVTAYA